MEKRFLKKPFKTLFAEIFRDELYSRLSSIVTKTNPNQNRARMTYQFTKVKSKGMSGCLYRMTCFVIWGNHMKDDGP